ncbi:MAG: NifB/NifX family molybdenum-iron cluster-binding protein, partial [Aristaeellaceae bacterium]
MRLAVAYEDGQVFQHFGHTAQFMLCDAEDGRMMRREIVTTGSSGHGALAGFLREKGVGAVICGGIGGGAR